MASEHSVIAVFDRGVAMFEAVAVAVIAIKSPDRDLTKARATLHNILEENHLQVPKERLAILFKHGDSLEQSPQITMSRESGPEDERYRTYQLLLQSELQHQERSEVYKHVIGVEPASSIGDVQNKLREAIFHETQNPLFVPLLHRVDSIYALADSLSQARAE